MPAITTTNYAEKTTPGDTDLLLLQEQDGDTRVITYADFKAAVQAAAFLKIPVTLYYWGELEDEVVFGYFKAPTACRVVGMQIFAQVAPVGANVTVDIVNASGTEQNKIATLTGGNTKQTTIFGTPLDLAENDEIQAKVKSIGSTTPGANMLCNLIIEASTG